MYFNLKCKGALALDVTFTKAIPQALSVQDVDVREDLLELNAKKRVRTTKPPV